MTDFLPTDQLDFASLRQNLKEFLQAQDIFKDYNFEGSNISVLLDILAYNTYQNAFYLNMIGNEMFLDTAILRDSVVSHAKELNYLPRSYTSAVASIQVQVNVTNPALYTITLPQGFKFTGSSANGNYVFSTNQPYVIERNANNEFIANVEIYEGFSVTEKFVVNTGIEQQRFVLSNDRIDTSSLEVFVSPSTADQITNTEYLYTTSIFGLNGNSTVYFLQPAEDGKYEIQFGDDVFGKKPTNGNVIKAEYRVSSGNTVNGVSSFTPSGTLTGYSITTSTLTPADGGAIAESIASIKTNAPRFFQTQDRMVTVEDYKALLVANFPEIKSINVYGGEEVPETPQYGKVIISAVTQSGDPVTQTTTDRMINFIRQRSPLSINPEIIQPEFLDLVVNTTVRYNVNRTKSNNNQIKNRVFNAINNFNSANLVDFGKTFRFSKFVTAINSADRSIVGNETSIILKKTILPILNQSYTATIDFGNAILRDDYYVSRAKTNVFSVYSSMITYNSKTAYFGEDGAGKLIIFERTNTGRNILVSNAGTINYETGVVSLSNVVINDYVGDGLIFYAIPRKQDIYTYRNNVIRISDVGNRVTVEAVKE